MFSRVINIRYTYSTNPAHVRPLPPVFSTPLAQNRSFWGISSCFQLFISFSIAFYVFPRVFDLRLTYSSKLTHVRSLQPVFSTVFTQNGLFSGCFKPLLAVFDSRIHVNTCLTTVNIYCRPFSVTITRFEPYRPIFPPSFINFCHSQPFFNIFN